ncbi:hypothetical protein [Arthrobacter sp. SDTb3-6]|uniref:hypothetical protein n=1 Tax=Arthrobacter sp. SDTb3-6 TaxID=2713571 RepID=UPI00159DB401|nr:hypothetical protein [Arthrobacter sp. SDTb3-6]NVM97678.1 hypothetical protein [Arthrobacter sp. SDTb3-6]
MTITKPQAQALAALLHELRPEWVPASLMTLIWEHRDDHPFPELTAAAVAVAINPDKRTPGIIFLPGTHWHLTAQKPAPQQFLTTAEKRRLAHAQRAGYDAVKNGVDPFDTSTPFHIPVISPDDLNPAATMEAFQRGQDLARWEQRQHQPGPAAIEAPTTNVIEEAAQ